MMWQILDAGFWMLDKIRDDIRFNIEYQVSSIQYLIREGNLICSPYI